MLDSHQIVIQSWMGDLGHHRAILSLLLQVICMHLMSSRRTMTRLRCFLYHLPLSLLLILCIRLVLLIYVDIAAFALIDR